ncbi:sigma-54-dependent Fis family transcriptional regulator [Aggregicoccus sp. 17bor-14]|uniref:sigma-54-dependent transcriptional regulator n=1 Tax=Myxococcaceae TaxID=31 RepID=UPI00129CCE31|nr:MULTISPECIES: sigma-54 dependent transcriptional regulator [Myxococcaceae]MBF5045741.1 sigma-54-dependent Fis family transcriptional regulator [Simulacricoccus sp. 17bor-14]MRI91477.1 sigma-54-dependent Fis family transcriptional regulator [Aggregicoccus sp. 17bor-14]
MAKERILVVDDEANARRAIATILAEEGYEVQEAADGLEALGRLPDFSPAVVLTDVRMPQMDGLTLMRRAREAGSDATFVVMTAFASVEAAVEAMRAGAETYLTKPLDMDAVLVVLGKALETRRLKTETVQLRERVAERYRVGNIIGDAPELQGVYALIRQAAPTKATVLILGESGTGKELVAQALHELSPRKDKPFVKVHCAALSEGLLESELFGHERGAFTGAVARKEGRFEMADGGTLFLDEIGEISPAVQVKLLRVLQNREFERVGGTQTLKVDVRIVAATHRDLQAEVKAGRFREDLYYRLNVVAVTLPPLRRRKGDIPALVSHFLERSNAAYGKSLKGLAPGTLQALLSHDWPGNIRELENAVERAVVLAQGEELTADDLPPVLRGPRPSAESGERLIPGATLAAIEREAILRTLEMVQGSTARAAEVLGISVRKIQYKLKEYAGGGSSPDPEASEAS